jgi:hypothetical protein
MMKPVSLSILWATGKGKIQDLHAAAISRSGDKTRARFTEWYDRCRDTEMGLAISQAATRCHG